MKFNKLVIFMLCVIFALSFVFVACEAPQGGCQNHIDGNNDGKCDSCNEVMDSTGDGTGTGSGNGNGGAGVVKGEQVTAEVWLEQLKLESHSNFALTLVTIEEYEGAKDVNTMEFLLDSNKFSEKYSSGENNDVTRHYIYDFSQGEAKSCVSLDGGDFSSDMTTETLQSCISKAVNMGNFLDTLVAPAYTSAVYDASTGKYTIAISSDEGGETTLGTAIILFSANKLVSVHCEMTWVFDGGEEKGTADITIGDAVVTIPTVYVVSSTIWNDQVVMLNHQNFTTTMTMEGMNTDYSTYYDNGKYAVDNTGDGEYDECIDWSADTTMRYLQREGKWEVSAIDLTPYSAMWELVYTLFSYVLPNEMHNAIYDETTHKYSYTFTDKAVTVQTSGTESMQTTATGKYELEFVDGKLVCIKGEIEKSQWVSGKLTFVFTVGNASVTLPTVQVSE